MSLTLRPSSNTFETLSNLPNRTSHVRCATIEDYRYDMTCRTEMDYPTNLKTEGDDVFRDISFGKTTAPTTSPVKVNSSGNNSNEGIESIMPYHQVSKAKMALYTPFHWNYERGMTDKLSKGSIYLLKEVHPEKLFSLKMDSKPLYQIQPNAERIIGWRKHIADNIKLYYKLHFYERMKIDFSSEYIAVTSDLQKIADTIESARPTDNNNGFAETLLSECLSQEIIDSHAAIIEPILNQKFLPTLSQLKKEFYTTGYADDRLAYLIESVSTLFRDVNQTIAIVSETKKKFEEATSFSSIKKSRTDKFLSLKSPKVIYDQFIRTITWIKMFKNEVNSFDKLKKLLLTNLKAAIVAQAFGSYGENLYNLNGKLVEVYNQLKKRSQKSKKPNATPVKSRPNIKSPVTLKIKEVVDEGVLEKKHIDGIHQMIQFVDAFTSSVEKFCKDMNKKRDEEISEMLTKVTDVLDTFELDLQGFTHSQIILRDVEQSIKAILREKQEEVDEVSLAKNYSRIKNQIKTITLALDLNLSGSGGITAALDKAYEKHLTISKKKRFECGNYLSEDHYYAKIAKIVRRRMKLKNELMTSTYTRVQKSVNLDDVIEFFGSKKIWQSITSKDSHQVNIRGFMQNSSKPVYHKISVNPDLEKCVLTFIKTFVGALA